MAFQTYSLEDLEKLDGTSPQPAKAAAGPDGTVDPAQMQKVYLPLARLIQNWLLARQALRLTPGAGAAPFIIGLAGSVAAGKSSIAARLQNALAASLGQSEVVVVNGDGFLYPNAHLQERGLMERKGFPETYDHGGMIDFLLRLKSGEKDVPVPVYSHVHYDVIPEDAITLRSPRIVILEGINILQPHRAVSRDDHLIASDLLDFSIYLHAEEALVKRWFTERFLTLTAAAAQDPKSFYQRFVPLSDQQRLEVVDYVWNQINGKNLNENILPTRARADLVLHKGMDHQITHFELRH